MKESLGTMHMLLLAALLAVQTVAPAPLSAEDLGRGYYLFLQGRSLEGADDLTAAIESYRQASVLMPGRAEIRTALAGLYVRQNQLIEAQREAAAALAVEPNNREAHRLLGGIQTAAIEASPAGSNVALIADAIEHLEQSVEGQGTDLAVDLALSSLYLRSDAAPKAIGRLQKLLVDYPSHPAALRLLVRAYEAVGQVAEAGRARAELASAPPDELEGLVRQIGRLERSGRWTEAATAWREVLRGDPGSAIYLTRYGAALANAGRLQEARTVMLQATRDSPRDAGAWYLLSLVEARAGNAQAAEAAAKRITAIDPNDARGPLGVARARSAANDDRGAVDVLGPRVSAPRSDDVTSGMYTEMATDLGAAYLRLGEHKRAIEMLEGARVRVPKDEDLLFRLGAAYEQGRKFDQAERAFRDLIGVNPKHADALNYLGYMLAERGRKLPEAVDLIRRALAIDEDNPSFLDSLGWAYFKQGQLENARQPLEKAAAALPRVSVIHDHLGDLYFEMKRYAEAAEAFDRALSGDRDGIDAGNITKKRDRARTLALAGQS